MSRSASVCGSSNFGKYVDEILSKLPGAIRRDAEANIMQELHRAQRAAEHSHTQPPPSQDQQFPIEFQQQATWQPQPSHWPPRPIGPPPSIWGSQDRSYVQQQFPTPQMTCPQTNKPQSGPSFVSLLRTSTPDAGSFNLSSQLNTPDPLAKDDDTDLHQEREREDPLDDQ